jgi:hypothetical protein
MDIQFVLNPIQRLSNGVVLPMSYMTICAHFDRFWLIKSTVFDVSETIRSSTHRWRIWDVWLIISLFVDPSNRSVVIVFGTVVPCLKTIWLFRVDFLNHIVHLCRKSVRIHIENIISFFLQSFCLFPPFFGGIILIRIEQIQIFSLPFFNGSNFWVEISFSNRVGSHDSL